MQPDASPLEARGQRALALRPPTRAEILELERAMVAFAVEVHPEQAPGCTDSIAPVKHHFAPGMYAREIFLPAGTRIIGKIHRTSHLMTICRGSGVIWNEFEVTEFIGTMTKLTRPGAKNVVLAITDTVIVTYHPTHHTTVEAVEREVIAASYDDFDDAQAALEDAS